MKSKVLFITSAMCKGGAETQLVKVALFLSSLGCTVQIISLKPINEFEINYDKEGIPVLFLKNWSRDPVANCRILYKSVKEFKPDIVIAFMFIAIIFARILKLLLNFRLISSIRIAVLTRKWYIPFLMTSGLDDAIVFNSRSSKANFENKGFTRKKGIVINNGIFIPQINPKIQIETKEFIWVCIAHFRWNKDYVTLFKAIAILKGLNFRVNIIGEYNHHNNPFRIIKDLDIEDHVNVLGFKQHTAQYLDDADAFVLSSFSEGMPNALLEAMAYSKPVVVTNIECNNEVLHSSGCGFLFNQGDEYDLADKMLSMMNLSVSARKVLGANGRGYIQKNFAEDGVMKNWLKIINQYSSNPELIPDN